MSFIFNGNEDPKTRDARKQKAVMGALQAGASKQPTDLGSGLSALGSALAYRSMQAPDPSNTAQAAMGTGWDGFGGMSPAAASAASQPPAAGFSMGKVAKALFGFGGR